MNRITLADLHAQMKAQGVSTHDHSAFKCPACGTAQSMATLRRAGVPGGEIERVIAFSCEGRWTKAGPPAHGDSAEAEARRKIRGCDWTLGGLFRIHTLEVIYPDGVARPTFELAKPDEAQALERWVAQQVAA